MIERQVGNILKQIYGKIVHRGGLFEKTGKIREHIPKPSNEHFLTFEDVLQIKSGKINHMHIVLPPHRICTYRLERNDKVYFPDKSISGVFRYMNKYAVTGPGYDIYWKVSPELLKFLDNEYYLLVNSESERPPSLDT